MQNDSIYQRFDVIIQSITEALNDVMKEEIIEAETNQVRMIE